MKRNKTDIMVMTAVAIAQPYKITGVRDGVIGFEGFKEKGKCWYCDSLGCLSFVIEEGVFINPDVLGLLGILKKDGLMESCKITWANNKTMIEVFIKDEEDNT